MKEPDLDGQEAQIWAKVMQTEGVQIRTLTRKDRENLRRRLHRWRRAMKDTFGFRGTVADAFQVSKMYNYIIRKIGDNQLVIELNPLNFDNIEMVDLETGDRIDIEDIAVQEGPEVSDGLEGESF